MMIAEDAEVMLSIMGSSMPKSGAAISARETERLGTSGAHQESLSIRPYLLGLKSSVLVPCLDSILIFLPSNTCQLSHLL